MAVTSLVVVGVVRTERGEKSALRWACSRRPRPAREALLAARAARGAVRSSGAPSILRESGRSPAPALELPTRREAAARLRSDK